MKIKTSELIGDALDWAAMKSLGDDYAEAYEVARPSRDWDMGGSIITWQGIGLKAARIFETDEFIWFGEIASNGKRPHVKSGDTPLVAAMRALVLSKLGSEVEIPAEVLEEEEV